MSSDSFITPDFLVSHASLLILHAVFGSMRKNNTTYTMLEENKSTWISKSLIVTADGNCSLDLCQAIGVLGSKSHEGFRVSKQLER